ncbi:MAG TPA: hypothetical protein DCE41_31060 [Cytophagales bacterium]|nr:hypothetical protein [Cytophagales bacterium]HAA22686.1 hypothetical protein [Cytophagales bacterium]HAP65081.1 hypothetical protein [Cytophagales bacterium]
MSRELLQRARTGDALALNELIERHKEMAYSIAFKYLKNKEDAEDVVQDAFVNVLNSIKKFRNQSKFSTWLYKIIYHECLKQLKSKNKAIEYVPQFAQWEPAAEDLKEEVGVEEGLNQLNANEFTVISLFYLEEKSIKEINQITSFSPANIKVLLHRARAKMKEFYNKKYAEDEG